jgi:pimeloyl-ACP methyl ester carboxylesterase
VARKSAPVGATARRYDRGVASQVSGGTEQLVVSSGQAGLAVRRAGAGGAPSVVCLHAGIADSRSFTALMEALAPDMDVVAYDRRGFGATSYAAEAHDQVVDLRAVLDALGLRRVVLVGNSRGGQIALDFAIVHPERVAALVLIAPAVSGAPQVQSSELRRDEVTFWATLEAAEAADNLDALNEGEIRLWLDGLTGPEDRIGAELRALALEMNGIALSAESPGHEPNVVDAWNRLREVRCPVLVVVGDLDTSYMQKRCRALVELIPGAELEVMDGTAHLPAFEAPRAFADLLVRFLSGRPL